MTVPYTFAASSGSIPLSYLDSNFATTITMGNTAVQLGDTITTFNNVTLASPTITAPNMSAVTISSGNATVTSLTATTVTASGNVQMASANSGQLAGLRNRIINGAMQVSQRNAAASFNITTTAGYTLDRWSGQTTGATVTGQQAGYANTVSLSSVSNSYSVTGAASNTGVFLIQRIEAKNCRDLAGQSVTLSLRAYVSGAAPTSFNWALRYATVTDTFTSVTAISNGTFTLTTADNVYSATISVPTAATTGLELLLSTGAFTSGTLFFTNVQLEVGPVATPFEQIPYGLSLQLCQRYYAFYTAIGPQRSTTVCDTYVNSPVVMRTTPSVFTYGTATIEGTGVPAGQSTVTTGSNSYFFRFETTFTAAGAVGTPCSQSITASAEL